MLELFPKREKKQKEKNKENKGQRKKEVAEEEKGMCIYEEEVSFIRQGHKYDFTRYDKLFYFLL